MRASNPQLDIDLAALCANYRSMANAGNAEAAAVVKCDGYGIGAAACARALADKEGCEQFFVAYSEEGAVLRKELGNRKAQIFVFNGPVEETISVYAQADLTPVINCESQARLWVKKCAGAPAALHIDTGMNRTGIALEDVSAIAAITGLNICVVMSHLACVSVPSDPMNEKQRRAFDLAAKQFPHAKKSLASSGGAYIGGDFCLDLVRLGVGLYGVSPFDEGEPRLRPVATLTAPVMQVRKVKIGEPIGYGGSFKAEGDSVLATVLLGYGDGFLRSGSNRASALVNGEKCPVIGRVSMDLTILDVTALAVPPKEGDRAEFFGPNLPIEEAAEACGTIGYELLTGVGGLARSRSGLGGRVLRRYLWEGAPAESALTGAEG